MKRLAWPALLAALLAAGVVAIPALGAPGDAPDTVIDSGPSGLTREASPAFSYHSTLSGSTFECSVDTGTPAFGPCVQPTAPLADGSYTFRVRAVSGESIPDPTPATREFRVDTTPPDTIIDSAPSGETTATELSFSFHSTEPESTFECSTDTGTPAFRPCVSVGSTLADGTYIYRVRAIDPAGNVDPTPATQAFTVVEPPPVYATSINVDPISGSVKVREPGRRKFVVISSETHLKIGSTIDASAGNLHLITEKRAGGPVQSADFHSGVFKVTQPGKGKPVTVLDLVSELACSAKQSASASGAKGNGLWGSGHGHYRTVGNHGSATVRGTIWFTADLCEGTLFKVSRGVVLVRDFTENKTIACTRARSTWPRPRPPETATATRPGRIWPARSRRGISGPPSRSAQEPRPAAGARRPRRRPAGSPASSYGQARRGRRG